MENQVQDRGTEGLIVFRFPKIKSPELDLSEGTIPLRLKMRPGTICLELKRSGLVLGRHSAADVRLSLPDISRQHCRFLYTDGQWEVLDLDSLNGTFVNGERLQKSVLCHGDQLRIASINFVVELSEPDTGDSPDHSAVLQRIADVLPGPDPTQEYRRAS